MWIVSQELKLIFPCSQRINRGAMVCTKQTCKIKLLTFPRIFTKGGSEFEG
jgi:hypothetical protein